MVHIFPEFLHTLALDIFQAMHENVKSYKKPHKPLVPLK